MIDYTIMEYNVETRRYKVIGIAEGIDSNQAKAAFIKQNHWEPRNENIILFAKIPVCR
tara:strand:- start:2901 stop:3074 length:174 start_codon:yes stop_codon:yes gene_type:complete